MTFEKLSTPSGTLAFYRSCLMLELMAASTDGSQTTSDHASSLWQFDVPIHLMERLLLEYRKVLSLAPHYSSFTKILSPLPPNFLLTVLLTTPAQLRLPLHRSLFKHHCNLMLIRCIAGQSFTSCLFTQTKLFQCCSTTLTKSLPNLIFTSTEIPSPKSQA